MESMAKPTGKRKNKIQRQENDTVNDKLFSEKTYTTNHSLAPRRHPSPCAKKMSWAGPLANLVRKPYIMVTS